MTAYLAGLRSSTAALSLGLDDDHWTDADVRAPSVLPGWTRGHVLTHIARNADSISNTVAGALRGEMVPRYPGGPEQREADIEAGAGRGVLELFTDVRESAERLDRLFAAAAEADAWDVPCHARTIGEYVPVRWRELEVHRVDLGGRYGPRDWPPAFVSYVVQDLVDNLDDRLDGAVVIEIVERDSVTTDLPGSRWTFGAGDPVEVSGPDWAVAAWLAGRANTAAEHLSAAPALKEWM